MASWRKWGNEWAENVELKVYQPNGHPPHHFGVQYNIGQLGPRIFRLKVEYLLDLPLPNHNDSLAFIYLLPGHAPVQLLADGRVVHEEAVYTKTKGWEAYYRPSAKSDQYPKLPLDSLIHGLRIGPQELIKAGFDTSKDHWVNIYNMRPFEAEGDACTLTLSIRNPYRPSEISKGTQHIALWGETGVIDIHFCQKGNAYLVNHVVSERHITQNEADLSAFSIPTMNWHEVSIRTKKKQVEIQLDGQLLDRFAYHEAIRPIARFKIWIQGLRRRNQESYIQKCKRPHNIQDVSTMLLGN